jgi:DNA polymerase-4
MITRQLPGRRDRRDHPESPPARPAGRSRLSGPCETKSVAIQDHWILHVDLDQFIAAVEVLRHPELRGRPVVVGGDGDPAKRGVVATASYEARQHGVHSGLPMRTAARRCPDAVFLPSDRDAYEAASDRVMTALRQLGYITEVLGWDEAFVAAGTGDPEAVARRIQQHIKASTQLDSSVGIGENRIQAKLATNFAKPAGLFRLTSQTWFGVLGGKPTGALLGVGAKTEHKLAELGIGTVAELAAADLTVVAARFGPTIGPWLVQTANGLGSAEVSVEPYIPRSRSRETTFQRNIEDWARVRQEVLRLAGQVTRDVEAERRPAVRIVVKVRHAPFFTSTHGQALAEPTSDGALIGQAALAALDKFTDRRPVRLLGVRAEFADAGR